MLKVNSGGDGCSGNWERFCDTCKAPTCTIYNHTALAYLCNSCDERVRAANSMGLSTEHGWIYSDSVDVPAAFTCKGDVASICVSCDVHIHSANALARQHFHVPMPPFSGLASAPSTTYLDELPSPMLEPENDIMTYSTEEIDEEEADSWLLLDPDNNHNQTNSWFTNGEEVDKSLGIKEHNSCSEYRSQDQNNQQQIYCSHQGDSGSDGIVPVQSFEDKQEVRHQQQQQQENFYINRQYGTPKASFINIPSSGQSVPLSFINAGLSPEATISEIPCSYTRYPNRTTDFFPNLSFPMPLQFTTMNREAKVLRYREKRKARKFEKKIRYASRKAYAEARPRVKGRFARKTEMDFEVDQMFSAEDYGYGIVPSY
ncbi:hypothetical protein Ddye_002072 [Dipteronia dyeriana]|uniref:CCT domain-containing protein n=1 Tax=Dipteronia dyeriana TaxID=168575 RepID=A0AAD9XQE2_9ROSI|nr:hypothetical protein Ddye_002072 [Dipteronia dyeriana]